MYITTAQQANDWFAFANSDRRIFEMGKTRFEAVGKLVMRLQEENLLTGVDLVELERRRQIEQEGWSAEHDSRHRHGELAQAAACYALESVKERAGFDLYQAQIDEIVSLWWPFEVDAWKPKDQMRD